MATKDTATLSGQAQEPAAAAPQASAANTADKPAASKKQEVNASGIYCYIGPSIRGLIRNGDVFRGSRAKALKAAAAAIERQPLVKTLIVSGDTLSDARIKVKTPGNALYRNYQRIAGK